MERVSDWLGVRRYGGRLRKVDGRRVRGRGRAIRKGWLGEDRGGAARRLGRLEAKRGDGSRCEKDELCVCVEWRREQEKKEKKV